MTIVPLTPSDNEGLGMCGLPHNFAIRVFHCKSQVSGKSRKMAFWAPLAFRKAHQGELLVVNGCNGKTWGGTGSVPD